LGRVYWITGLAGAGKTTIGKELYKEIKKTNPATVLLDGDIMREVFGADLGYTIEERKKCAMRYSRICKMLVEQGITVICCTISMFDIVRDWNSQNISNYVEVYVRVSMDTLHERNQKKLYREGTDAGASVVGLDIPMEEPKNPHIIIDNDEGLTVSDAVDQILKNAPI
jgi:adenylylsulfate kinase